MRYYIADLHNYDENIMVYEHRPFKNCEHMRNEMINRWNSIVTENDEVFLLGDIGNPEIITQLHGKITIVLGNHDVYDDVMFFAEGNKNIEISKYPILVGGSLLSHEPITFLPKEFPYLNIHGHIHHFNYGINSKKWSDGNRYFCVSVEQIGYKPISEKEIIKLIEYKDYCERSC